MTAWGTGLFCVREAPVPLSDFGLECCMVDTAHYAVDTAHFDSIGKVTWEKWVCGVCTHP